MEMPGDIYMNKWYSTQDRPNWCRFEPCKGGFRLKCEQCNGTFEVVIPSEVREVVAVMYAFMDLHKRCKTLSTQPIKALKPKGKDEDEH